MKKEQSWVTGRRELLGALGLSVLAEACGGLGGDEPMTVVARKSDKLAVPPERTPETNAFAMGVASGDVTSDGAIVWAQYAGTAELELVVYGMDAGSYAAEVVATAVPVASGGFVHVAVSELEPRASYRYVFFELDGARRVARSPIGAFRTAPSPSSLVPVTFGATACTSNGRAMDTLARAAERNLDLFLLLGDTTYNDGARNLDEFRARWRQNFSTAGYRALRASTSILATWDDHEVTNDWNPETLDPRLVATARQTFFENLPIRRDPTSPDRIWRKVSWGATADFFVLDCRSERRPSTRYRDDATYLSRAQMDWLKAELSASTAVFKVILNTVPISDFPGLFDFLKKDRWEGYPAQREELLRHIEGSRIGGVLFVAGDFHLGSVGRIAKRGLGSSLVEVLAGPGAQGGNPLASSLGKDQFDWFTATSNCTSFELDPTSRSVSVRYDDGAGRLLTERVYTL